jgi:glycosyltransferase involved in cell wall biosynthesis
LAEGLAVVLGEALSFSLPIIASDATGVENLISDPEAYVKVASGDVESLRQAFEMLIINRSHLDFLSRRSRQHVLERSVGWEEYGNSWRNLLNFHR